MKQIKIKYMGIVSDVISYEPLTRRGKQPRDTMGRFSDWSGKSINPVPTKRRPAHIERVKNEQTKEMGGRISNARLGRVGDHRHSHRRTTAPVLVLNKVKSFVYPLVEFLFLAYIVWFGYQVIHTAPHTAKIIEQAHAAAPAVIAPEKPQKSPEQEIVEVFGTDTIMLKIARCESNLNPRALNKNRNHTEDRGLLQINSNTWGNYTEADYDLAYDQTANILVAKLIYDARGTSPWRSSAHCWQHK